MNTPSPAAGTAVAFMLSGWPFTPNGYADFYSWDGSFLRRISESGNLLASRDGRYFVNYTTAKLATSRGSVIATIEQGSLAEGRTSPNWAADGDYLCSLEQNASGYSLVVTEVSGKVQRFHLDVPSLVIRSDGLRSMGIECSLTGHRAVVFGGAIQKPSIAILNLPDGHLERVFDLHAQKASFSLASDLGRFAETTETSDHWYETDVVDVTDGAVKARLQGNSTAYFTPDGKNLLVQDPQGTATSILDWGTATKVWSGRGHLEQVVAASDPATNKILLWLSTGYDQAGTTTYDYWIVDGAGSGFRFTPRDCGTTVASASRC